MKSLQHFSTMILLTVIMCLVYAGIQQNYRSNANDPQIQIAHELRDRLQQGKPLIFDDTVTLERSLSVFKESFDAKGNPVQSTGFIYGRMPQLPKGVFEYAKAYGENRITWQPRGGIRMAAVIVAVNASPMAYLAVGRSLKEVEERISGLARMVFISWLLCISVVLINWLVTYYNHKKQFQ